VDAEPNLVTLKTKAARFSETSEQAYYPTQVRTQQTIIWARPALKTVKSKIRRL
jgi:hypothetical protein